jgi:hypothetical protein
VAGCCEHGNELSGSIKDGQFDYLNVLQASQRLYPMQLVVIFCISNVMYSGVIFLSSTLEHRRKFSGDERRRGTF